MVSDLLADLLEDSDSLKGKTFLDPNFLEDVAPALPWHGQTSLDVLLYCTEYRRHGDDDDDEKVISIMVDGHHLKVFLNSVCTPSSHISSKEVSFQVKLSSNFIKTDHFV